MTIKLLDASIENFVLDLQEAVADTNKMVLTKRDMNKLRAIKRRLEYTRRQLDEIYSFVSTRLQCAIGGQLDAKTEDRLAGLPKK